MLEQDQLQRPELDHQSPTAKGLVKYVMWESKASTHGGWWGGLCPCRGIQGVPGIVDGTIAMLVFWGVIIDQVILGILHVL